MSAPASILSHLMRVATRLSSVVSPSEPRAACQPLDTFPRTPPLRWSSLSPTLCEIRDRRSVSDFAQPPTPTKPTNNHARQFRALPILPPLLAGLDAPREV